MTVRSLLCVTVRTLRLMTVAATFYATAPLAAQNMSTLPVEDRARAVECLALAIAYEAGYEKLEGQQAVAEVVLNRVRSASFPKSVCDVVFAGSTRKTGCQFTFTCDGSLRRKLPDRIMAAARTIAGQAIDGSLPLLVSGATHYHADYVSPYWAPSLVRIAKIGAHIFYRRPGAGIVAGPLPAQAAVPGPVPPAQPPQVFAPWGLAPPVTLTAAPAPAGS